MVTGKILWSDQSFKNSGNRGNSSTGKDGWMRFKPGSNPVRILTDPYQYYTHKVKFEGDKGFGSRIPCAKPKDCIACNSASLPTEKAKRRWYLGVIDRTTGTYKIMDVSWSVLSSIQTYADNEDWGDPSEYDFDVIANPKADPQNYYKVVAKPKKPLSAADLLIRDKDVDIAYLERRCEPLSSEKVEEIYNEQKAKFASASKPNINAPADFTDEDEDTEFQNADTVAASELPF